MPSTPFGDSYGDHGCYIKAIPILDVLVSPAILQLDYLAR